MNDHSAILRRPAVMTAWRGRAALAHCRSGLLPIVAAMAACVGTGAAEQLRHDGAAPPLVLAQAEAGTIPEPTSAAGSYLAGRHARLRNDTEAALRFYLRALQDDPGNPRLIGRSLMAALAERDFAVGAGLAERLVAADPRSPIGNVTLSISAVRGKNWGRVAAPLENLPASGLNRYLAPLLTAWSLAATGDHDAAQAALEPLVRNSIFASTRDFHSALIADIFQRMETAETGYAGALSALRGVNLRVVLAAGEFYHRKGAVEEARAIYDGFLDRNPDTTFLDPAYRRLDDNAVPPLLVSNAGEGVAEALYGVAISLYEERAYELALAYDQLALILRPDFDAAFMLLGDILAAMERLPDAVEAYRAVPEASPLKWAVRLRTANSLANIGDIDAAAAQFRIMATERPERADPLISLADMLRRNERYGDAVDAYDQAFARIPTLDKRHWTLLYARGISLERSDQWQRAERDFLRALELEPDQPLVLNYLGYSWVEMGLNLDRARRMIEKAVEQRPNDGYIVDSLGWVLYRLGDFEEAVKYLERAVEIRPNDPVILDHFGDGLWRVQRRSEARFQWRRALSFEPDEELSESIRKKLNDGLPAVPLEGRVGLEDL